MTTSKSCLARPPRMDVARRSWGPVVENELTGLSPFELGYARTELRRKLVDAALGGENDVTP